MYIFETEIYIFFEGGGKKKRSKSARKPSLANYILVPSCELGFGSAEEVGDEVGLAADVNVMLVRAAAQALVKGGAVALLFAAVQLADQDGVSPQDFVFAVSAKPSLKEKKGEL